MMLRSKGEQEAYLDGFMMCAECLTKYLTPEERQKLECMIEAVRYAISVDEGGSDNGKY